MKMIDAHSTVQFAQDTAGARKSGTSRALRLEKQTIRTLTGAELRRVGGGCSDTTNTCPGDTTITDKTH
jgi:hypothetical protein